MIRNATISECGRFRFELRRVWDAHKYVLVVCMLNPSTADAEKDDPTVLALIHFARLWGYGGLHIINLYAFRASRPSAMMMADDRIGPGNSIFINHAAMVAQQNSNALLIAWGNHGDFEGRASWFCSMVKHYYGLKLMHLGRTKQGAPKHPMARGKSFIPRDSFPQDWLLSDAQI
jgi:hypothetical protein